jgi:3-phosphoshikimate 1-carboxyvinyltransferase
MLGAIADSATRIRNFLPANDCLASLGAMRDLGIEIEVHHDEVRVQGKGLRGLQEPYRPIECGGSGTTMRLLAGLLAGQPFYSVLAGNAQLSKRPMERVATPLRAMGAFIQGRGGGRYAPLSIEGGNLRGIRYSPPVASAQVKSAILLAGLFAEGSTVVEESLPTRDHTERMLTAMGASVHTEQGAVTLRPIERLAALDISVPGDISSAAFMLVAAGIVPGSRLLLPGVGVNPGRTGIISTLVRMGEQITTHNERIANGEPVADLEAVYAPLKGIEITSAEVPTLIDELPVLAVAATQAEGVTEVRGAGELRVKETDRIATTVAELRRMGAQIEALEDGFRVAGSARLRGARVSSHGDHRLAMALAVAALVAEGETTIEDTECIRDSFPGFESALARLSPGEERS